MKNEDLYALKAAIKSSIRTDGAEIFFYDQARKIWQAKTGNKAALELRRLLAQRPTIPNLGASEAKEVLADILCDPAFYRPIKATPVHLINCRNGVLNLKTGQLETEEKSETDFKIQINFEFQKEVTLTDCKEFCSLLKFIFKLPDDMTSDGMMDHPSVRRLLEMMGYLVSNEYRAKKMLILIGPAHSGKSQILELLRRVLGSDNTVALNLDELAGQSGGRFRTELLMKAHALINDELPTNGLKRLSELKKLIAGEYITIEAKGKRPMTIKNRTKLIFAGNQLPELDEADCGNAFSSRLCVVAFKNSVEQDKWDIKLVEKLFAERDAIFSVAVKCFAKILSDLNFTNDPDAELLLEAYKEENASVETFIKDSSVVCKGEGVYTMELYTAYTCYCKRSALTAVKNLKAFRQQLLSVPGIQIAKKRLNGDKVARSTVLGIAFAAHNAEV